MGQDTEHHQEKKRDERDLPRSSRHSTPTQKGSRSKARGTTPPPKILPTLSIPDLLKPGEMCYRNPDGKIVHIPAAFLMQQARSTYPPQGDKTTSHRRSRSRDRRPSRAQSPRDDRHRAANRHDYTSGRSRSPVYKRQRASSPKRDESQDILPIQDLNLIHTSPLQHSSLQPQARGEDRARQIEGRMGQKQGRCATPDAANQEYIPSPGGQASRQNWGRERSLRDALTPHPQS